MKTAMKIAIIAALLVTASALPSRATILLLGSNSGYIASVDTTTGAVSNAYQLGGFYLNWYDIAENDAGAIYTVGIHYGNPQLNTALYSIDPTAPSATRIGFTGPNVNGLAFGPGGTLFATGGSSLYTINTATGAATAVGSGIGGSFASSGDLTYGGGNSFFATSSNHCGGGGDCLWKIDQTTGIGTPVGSTGYYEVYGLAMIDGTLYGLTGNNQILSIDPTTGHATFLARYSDLAISGFAFGAAAPPSAAMAAVPEPATMPLLLLGLAGIVLLRRRQRAA